AAGRGAGWLYQRAPLHQALYVLLRLLPLGAAQEGRQPVATVALELRNLDHDTRAMPWLAAEGQRRLLVGHPQALAHVDESDGRPGGCGLCKIAETIVHDRDDDLGARATRRLHRASAHTQTAGMVSGLDAMDDGVFDQWL